MSSQGAEELLASATSAISSLFSKKRKPVDIVASLTTNVQSIQQGSAVFSTLSPMLARRSIFVSPTASSSAPMNIPSATAAELAHVTDVHTRIETDLDDCITTLFGDDETREKGREPDAKLAHELLDQLSIRSPDTMTSLVLTMRYLTLESRKLVTRVWQCLFVQRRSAMVDAMLGRDDVLHSLISAYESTDASLVVNADLQLQCCLRCRPLCRLVLNSAQPSLVDPFFSYLASTKAETNAAAWSTFKLIFFESFDDIDREDAAAESVDDSQCDLAFFEEYADEIPGGGLPGMRARPMAAKYLESQYEGV